MVKILPPVLLTSVGLFIFSTALEPGAHKKVARSGNAHKNYLNRHHRRSRYRGRNSHLRKDQTSDEPNYTEDLAEPSSSTEADGLAEPLNSTDAGDLGEPSNSTGAEYFAGSNSTDSENFVEPSNSTDAEEFEEPSKSTGTDSDEDPSSATDDEAEISYTAEQHNLTSSQHQTQDISSTDDEGQVSSNYTESYSSDSSFSSSKNTTLQSNVTNPVNDSDAIGVESSSNNLLDVFKESSLAPNGLFFGFLPDDGSSGGTRQTMAQLNAAIGGRSAVYGWYSQAISGTPYDGSQLLAVIDDVKASGCVFQPAVMPVKGWQGLTSEDNSQAVAIAKVMKKFTDEGIAVWLRFAHEVNYYQTDGTYDGTAADFKAGWAAVASAIKGIAPEVKMWWTPNVASAENYAEYEPDDMSTVDLVGIDYYPKKLSGNDFLSTMKDFHDKYAVDGRKFAIGETGLGWAGQLADKYQWLQEICAAKASMPEFVAAAWFNFDKEYDYKIAGEKTLNQKFTSFIATVPN